MYQYEEVFCEDCNMQPAAWNIFFLLYLLPIVLFYFILSFGELEYGKNAYKFSGKQSYKLVWPLV